MIGTGIGLLIAGLASGSAAAYGAHKAASTATKAGELEASAADKQLAFEKEQAARDQANWERAQQFNLDQYNARETRLAPFRNLGTNATVTLGNLIGGARAVSPTFAPPPLRLPPMAGAQPGASAGGPVSLNNVVRGRARPVRFSDML